MNNKNNWKGKLEKAAEIYDKARIVGKDVVEFGAKICVANVAHAVITNAIGNLDEIEGRIPQIATKIGTWVVAGMVAEAGVEFVSRKYNNVFPDIKPFVVEICRDKTPTQDVNVIEGEIIPT